MFPVSLFKCPFIVRLRPIYKPFTKFLGHPSRCAEAYQVPLFPSWSTLTSFGLVGDFTDSTMGFITICSPPLKRICLELFSKHRTCKSKHTSKSSKYRWLCIFPARLEFPPMFIYSFRQWLLSFVHRMATYVLSSSSQIGLLCYGRGMLVCRPRKHGTTGALFWLCLWVFRGLHGHPRRGPP